MYTPINTAPFNLDNLNALGSFYADQFGKDKTIIIRDLINNMIIDTAPKDYIDIKILLAEGVDTITNDEWPWVEKPYLRKNVITTVLGANITAGTQQTVPVIDTTVTTVGRILTYDVTNKKAIVKAVDPVNSTITIEAMSGQTLQQLNSGTSYIFNNSTSTDADGTSSIVNSSRLTGLQRKYNYIQLLSAMTSFGRIENIKYQNNEQLNYLAANLEEMRTQFYIDYSNAYWNGERGRTMSNGFPAKTCGGIIPYINGEGCLNINTTSTNLLASVNAAVDNTRYGSGNPVKYLYGTNKWLNALAQEYKKPLVRFQAANDNILDLGLNKIDFGTDTVVLVPMQRFEAKSNSFPAYFENQLILVPQENIRPKNMFAFRMAGVKDRSQTDTNTNNYSMQYMEGTLSTEINNALAFATIQIS